MELFKSIFSGSFTLMQFMIALVVSIILGVIVAMFYTFKSQHTKSLCLSIVMISAIETIVIMMVNGNLGAGIAVAGSFSLIRFRSVKGSARELACIFLAMANGIICGTGYVALAVVFTIVMVGVGVLLTILNFGKTSDDQKYLKITIPETLNYDEVFDEILKKYTRSYELVHVKTLNLGSLFRVEYIINLKDNRIKEMIDELRVRNGNLEISCGNLQGEKEEL